MMSVFVEISSDDYAKYYSRACPDCQVAPVFEEWEKERFEQKRPK